MIRKVSNPYKSMFLCGDFNLDLLKYNNNLPTKRFIDMMFSLGMFPLISKPSRITDVSATLIDNIFTNELTCTTTSGLLINDISDHLPVFAKCRYSCINRQVNKIRRLARTLYKDNIESLKKWPIVNGLGKYNEWNECWQVLWYVSGCIYKNVWQTLPVKKSKCYWRN